MKKKPIFSSTMVWLRISWLKFPCDDEKFSLARELCLTDFNENKRHFIVENILKLLKPYEKPFDPTPKDQDYYGNLLCDLHWVANNQMSKSFVILSKNIRALIET